MLWSPLFFVSYTSVDPHRWTPGNPLLFVGWVVSTPQKSSGGITIPKWNWTSNTYLKPATNTKQVISCIRAVAVYHLHKLWAANLFCYCDRLVPIGAWRPASAGLPTRLGVYMLLFHQSKNSPTCQKPISLTSHCLCHAQALQHQTLQRKACAGNMYTDNNI